MTPRLSILMTTDTVGGVWQYSLDLATALARLDVEVVLATLGPPPAPGQRSEADAAGVRLIVTDLPLDWLSDGPAPILAAGEAVAKLAADEHVDLVHLNTPTLAADGNFRMRVVAAVHGCVATWWDAAHGGALPADLGWQRVMTSRGLAAADIVVAPSASHAAAVMREYGLVRLPVVVHNGRMPLAPPRATLARHVLTAGRLWDRVKDTALLDRVASRLPVPIRAAGAVRGPHGETVAPRHLHLLGQLDGIALGAELAARPVFVSAARFEPFGLAVLEAAAAGCPLVLADIATFRELWDGVALFARAGDDAAFQSAIETLLNDQAFAERLGDAALVRARRYTPDATASAMAAVYAQLAEQRVAA